MKILFVSDLLEEISGAGNLSRMHKLALQQVFCGSNFYEVSLASKTEKEEYNYKSYKQINGLYKKIGNVVRMLPLKMNPEAASFIVNVIRKNKIDVLYIDNSIYGKTVYYIRKEVPELKIVTFYHDVKRALYKQWLRDRGFKYFPWFCIGILGEYLNQKYSDINIVLNKREETLFYQYYKKQPEAVIPITVPEPSIAETKPMNNKTEIDMLFIGAYYEPNLLGLEWFVNNVLPELPPKYVLTVVGRDMERISCKYHDNSRIRIIGTVDNLGDYYEASNCVIAPIFEGGGMKVKTAEAFSYGKPFIGTPESLEGYIENIPKHIIGTKIFCCHNKEEMINAIKTITINDYYDNEISHIYKKFYSLDALTESFSTVMNVL